MDTDFQRVIILLISLKSQNRNTASIKVIKGYAKTDGITLYNLDASGIFYIATLLKSVQ